MQLIFTELLDWRTHLNPKVQSNKLSEST